VKQKPLQSVGLVFVIGVLAGWVISALSRRD